MADSPKPRSRSTSRSRNAASGATGVAAGRAAATDGGSPSGSNDSSSASTAGLDPDWLADVEGLSFQEARTALELAMAQLQSDALEVEEMAGLYRRAEAYARRCEAVLQQVEQQVIQWDAEGTPPTP